MSTDYLQNPGKLKIDLMLRGIRIEDQALADAIKEHMVGTDGLDMVLPAQTLANVPYGEEFTSRSPYLFKALPSGGHAISDGKDEVEVELVPRSNFYENKTSTGVSFRDIATTHGSYVVITPQTSCEFFSDGTECRYCAGNFDTGEPGRTFTVEEVLEVVEVVKKEKAAGIIYLSVGFSRGDDGGIALLEPYLRAIKKFYNILVAVETLPPKQNKWIDDTYAMGADSVLYNLEIFDKELFELICPGRAKLIGRKRYLEALKYAATIFPSGTVASHLIVGLEPPGSTCKGIELLTGIGVVPILPIYRPSPTRALRIEPLTAEIIVPVYKQLYMAVKEKKINMNWVRDISVVSTPIEGQQLVEDRKSLLDGFYGSRIGLKAAWGLSTLRRRLRVKKTGADSDNNDRADEGE